MNRIDKLFRTKKENILSVYFTAGYPALESTVNLITMIEKNGADIVEIGIPYSDPLADGPVIQESGRIAIENGMTLKLLFTQLRYIRNEVSIPLLLMGYINPVLKFGYENFCRNAGECGIDGLIIPDLPMHEYKAHYEKAALENDLKSIFLITPDTSVRRIRETDSAASGFIYVVSSASTTGKTGMFGNDEEAYFKRISSMKLKNPLLAGFGIHNKDTFKQVNEYCNGAIIGSAFIRSLKSQESLEMDIRCFFNNLKS